MAKHSKVIAQTGRLTDKQTDRHTHTYIQTDSMKTLPSRIRGQ